MEDAFKLTPSCRIGKDNFTQACPVGAAIRTDYIGAKGLRNGFLHARMAGEQFMYAAIGVEKYRRQMLAKGGGKTRFSRRHSSGNAKRRHCCPIISA